MTALKRSNRSSGWRSSAWTCRSLAAGLSLAVAFVGIQPGGAVEPPVKIAVFDFELDDRSAGGGIIGPDANDTEHLKSATEEARRRLAASGRYRLVEVGNAAREVLAAGGIRHCNGCEAPLAARLGADQSLAGIVTRVTRTEYTLQVLIRDARTGEVLSNEFTGLRMGANYSWPRGVKWLMENKILAARPAQ